MDNAKSYGRIIWCWTTCNSKPSYKYMYNEKELYKDSTYSKMELIQKEGTRNVKRNVEFYKQCWKDKVIRREKRNLISKKIKEKVENGRYYRDNNRWV